MARIIRDITSPRLPYVWLVLAVALLAAISNVAGEQILHRLAELEDAPSAPVLAALALFALCSFASFYATRGTPLPSFVVAIALGIAGHTFFAPIVSDRTALASLVTGSAAVILFSGGLEMPLRDFIRLFVKIALLAVPGVLLTGYAFSLVVGALGPAMGIASAAPVVILLGAILASTDPAAIIPVLQNMRFKRRATKDIVVAESALNDVVGTLLTSAFLKLPLAALTVTAAYGALATPQNYRFLAEQTGYGVLFGMAGYVLLWILAQIKRRHSVRYGADQVYFLAAPIIAFTGAAALGGSGFLAAFVAGLLFHGQEHMKEIETLLLPGDRRRREAGDLPAGRRDGGRACACRLCPARHRRRADLHVRAPAGDGVPHARASTASSRTARAASRSRSCCSSPSCARPARSRPCCSSPRWRA